MISLKHILTENVEFDHDSVFSPFYTQVMQFEPEEAELIESSQVYPHYFSNSSPAQVHWQWETDENDRYNLIFNAILTKEIYDPDRSLKQSDSLDQKRYKIVTYCYNQKNNKKGICLEFCRTSKKFRTPNSNLKVLKQFLDEIDFIDEEELLDKKVYFFSRSMDLHL